MTSKATSLSMQRLAMAGLVEFGLPRAQVKRLRHFFVTGDIDDLLTGKIQANPEFPCVNADFEIGKFVRGYIIGVSRKHQSKCELKWLQGSDEVWVYCFRDPKPGWRLFGRFIGKNIFVGLHCVSREEAGDLIQYTKQSRIMVDKWNAIFPNESPFIGNSFADYLGDLVVER